MKLKLIKKIKEAEGTKSFYWKPDKTVKYLPGQFFYYTLPKLTHKDSKGPNRMFTLSSSPTEGDTLRFTTRMRDQSGYKQSIDNIKIGSTIEGEGPDGTFILDEKTPGSHVFLAGGIGITPFRSMIKYSIDKKLKNKLTLIYANSTFKQIAFRDELEQMAKNNPNISIYMTVSKKDTRWRGHIGRIDKKLIKKLLSKSTIVNATFWVAGPPSFVDAMKVILSSFKISPSKIIDEKFTGY